MKKAIVLKRAEIRKIIAAYFGVKEKDVLPSKFSFTVIVDENLEKTIIKL